MLRSTLLFIFIISCSNLAIAQSDSLNKKTSADSIRQQGQIDSLDQENKTKINIIHADDLFGEKKGEIYYNRLIGNVQVKSDDIFMTCDSAYLNLDNSFIRAFGNVDIKRGGTTSAKANYVEYTGLTAQSVMKDNVQIYDEGNTLVTDDLSYNLRSKIGIYKNGGSLVAKETTVSSEYGRYNGRTKKAYFKQDVFITNPDSDIESKELMYDTKDKSMRFLDQTTVFGKEATIVTNGGVYNENTGAAIFTKRTTVENSEQTITANKIKYNQKTEEGSARGKVIIYDKMENTTLYTDAANYNKETGYGQAIGHVHFVDNDEGTELYAGKVFYNEYNKFMLATERPLLVTISDSDSIFIASDTMINLRVIDTALLYRKMKYEGKYTYSLLRKKQEETYDDRKLVLCNRDVRIFSDSMQAICDSMSYAQSDSVFRLYKKPIMWSGTQQAIGDTIHIYTKNNNIDKLEIRGNSFLSNSTGYAKMYNQVKGRNIDAFFKDNAIQTVIDDGNAQSVYYAENDEKKFVGMNTAQGAQIKIIFEDKKINRIIFYDKPEGAFYPMETIPNNKRFLDGFVWKEKERPKSRKDLE